MKRTISKLTRSKIKRSFSFLPKKRIKSKSNKNQTTKIKPIEEKDEEHRRMKEILARTWKRGKAKDEQNKRTPNEDEDGRLVLRLKSTIWLCNYDYYLQPATNDVSSGVRRRSSLIHSANRFHSVHSIFFIFPISF